MARKTKHKFLAFIHCTILFVPIIFIAFYCLIQFNNGFTAGATDGLNYQSNFVLEDAFTYFNTNNQFTLSIVNIDFMSMMNISATNSYVVFNNWYLNYLINMELVLFMPEILLIVISGAKRLVLSWSDKIGESY